MVFDLLQVRRGVEATCDSRVCEAPTPPQNSVVFNLFAFICGLI